METNWDNDLLPALAGTAVRGIFGRPPGGNLTDVASKHIKAARDHGLVFGFSLDDLCLDNRELTRDRNRELRALLDRLVELDVGEVIVSSFFLLELIKDRYPSLSVTISDNIAFDSVQRVHEFVKLGADNVLLRDMNRDFKQLKTVAAALPGVSRLVVNRACVFDCALAITHANERSHIRDRRDAPPLLVADLCVQKLIQQPSGLIRARWIRPEDLVYYEQRGFDDFVIYAPARETDRILAAARAYDTRTSPDNLLDILSLPGDVRFEKVREAVRLDSAVLDSLVEGFMNKDCRRDDCDVCGYCSAVAARAVVSRRPG